MEWNALTLCQNDAAAGVYTQALAGFVQWLAPRYGEILQGLPTELRTLRQQVLHSEHRRTPDIVAHLALGMQYVLAYAHDCDALTTEECHMYWERTWQILCLSTDSFDGPLLVSFFHPLKSIMEEKAHDNAID